VVEKRLYEVLGRPGTCPHGNPIPGYSEAAPNELRLTNVDAGVRASITRVSEVAEREAPLLLAYLHERKLVPGQKIAVLEVDDVGRTLRVRAGGRLVTLSHDTAAKLWVVPTRTK
jgi:Iron dependent repressor, metal binding and dimerisation domain./FeoA domain.